MNLLLFAALKDLPRPTICCLPYILVALAGKRVRAHQMNRNASSHTLSLLQMALQKKGRVLSTEPVA